jgi:hypothetical protein
LANDYATLEDLQEIPKFDVTKYADICQFMLDSAAKHIDSITHRHWLAQSTASARLFTGSNSQIIEIDENTSVTALGFKYNFSDATYTTMATTDYIAFSGSNDSPNFNDKPYTKLMINPNGDFAYFPFVSAFGSAFGNGWYTDERELKRIPAYPSIQVTAKWGYADTVPDTIKHCTILQATRWIKRAQGVYGDAIGNIDTGQILYVNKMDKDMQAMLQVGGLIKVSVGSRRR